MAFLFHAVAREIILNSRIRLVRQENEYILVKTLQCIYFYTLTHMHTNSRIIFHIAMFPGNLEFYYALIRVKKKKVLSYKHLLYLLQRRNWQRRPASMAPFCNGDCSPVLLHSPPLIWCV